MLIDWFTIGAQALNFVVLVWLMKRFLYKPVQDAIAARETLIAGQIADADKKKAEAKQDRDDFQHKNDAFDQERAALLKKATDDASSERERLLGAAGNAADALAAKRSTALQADADSLSRGLRRRVQDEVFAIARKTLADLASASLDERICETFAGRLRDLEGAEKQRLLAAFDSGSEALIVRSAFELPAAQRTSIRKTVHETFATAAALQFETAPDLVGGIELSAGGHKLAWSIADYLTSLERGVGELLQSQAVPEATAPAPVNATAPKAAMAPEAAAAKTPAPNAPDAAAEPAAPRVAEAASS